MCVIIHVIVLPCCMIIFQGLNQGPKKLSVIGTASLNLAEFVSAADVETEINLPLLLPDARPESHPTLNVSVIFPLIIVFSSKYFRSLGIQF